MCVLRHDAGQERHVQLEEFVSQAIDGDRIGAGIAGNNFDRARCGWITIKGGLHIIGKRTANVDQPIKEHRNLLFCFLFKQFPGGVWISFFMPKCSRDLFNELIVDMDEQVTQVVLDVTDLEILSATKPWEKNFFEVSMTAIIACRLGIGT